MTGSIILDVFIGLIFIYLLYSLLAAVIMEVISSLLRLRARNLEWALNRMLLDHPEDRIKFFAFFKDLWISIASTFYNSQKGLLKLFYDHPTIKYLSPGGIFKSPSYINADTFSQTLVELLKEQENSSNITSVLSDREMIDKTLGINGTPTSNIGKETLIQLKMLWGYSSGDIEKFKSYLEAWFDKTNERAAGWYKRKVQMFLFLLGLILAVSFNVDSIEIAKKLSTDEALRTHTVNKAIEKDKLQNKSGSDNSSIQPEHEAIKKEIEDVNASFGQGWEGKGFGQVVFCEMWKNYGGMGYFLTALAISLGAPFWFDMLNKLIQLRSSVPQSSSQKDSRNMTGENQTPSREKTVTARNRKG